MSTTHPRVTTVRRPQPAPSIRDAPIAFLVATRRPIHLDPVTETIEKARRVGRIGVELTERRIVTLRDLDTDERGRPPDNFGADLRRRRRVLGRTGPVPNPVGWIDQFEGEPAVGTRSTVALGNVNVDHLHPPVDRRLFGCAVGVGAVVLRLA